MKCSDLVLHLLPVIVTSLGFSASATAARWDGFARPFVGPPNSAIQCSDFYGRPTTQDCIDSIEWITGINPANEDDEQAEQDGWNQLQEIMQTIVEFLTPQAQRRDMQRPGMRTPISWRYGDCVVSATVFEGQFRFDQVIESTDRSEDYAAWMDISRSSTQTVESCVEEQRRGGWQIIGENNHIVIEVASADSQHIEALEVNLGHRIPAYVSLPDGPIEPVYVSDEEDDDAEHEETICFSGPSAGWSLTTKSCCTGYKFISRKMRDLPVLLGVDGLSKIAEAIGVCSSPTSS